MKILLILSILIWANKIGQETPVVHQTQQIESGPSLPFSSQKKEKASAPSQVGKKFAAKFVSGINNSLFLAAFKRQANILLVENCLKTWHISPYSLSLIANLNKNGSLHKIQAHAHTETELPACLQEKLLQMSFKSLTADMQHEYQSIQWRLDW